MGSGYLPGHTELISHSNVGLLTPRSDETVKWCKDGFGEVSLMGTYLRMSLRPEDIDLGKASGERKIRAQYKKLLM